MTIHKIFGTLCLLVLCNLGFSQKLPNFAFTDLKDQPFTQQQLKADLPTIVIYFDPYCDHCTQQATWIMEAADKFKQINLLWVTTETQEATEEFVATYFADVSMPNNHVALDTEFMFDGYFGYSEVPSIYLYSAAGKRLKALDEETSAATLLQYLKAGS